MKCGSTNTSSHKTCNVTKLSKRCHGEFNYEARANIQIMVETLKDRQLEIIKESITEVEKGIEQKFFPKNLTNCRTYFGKNCPYLKYCLNKDKSGLEEVE